MTKPPSFLKVVLGLAVIGAGACNTTEFVDRKSPGKRGSLDPVSCTAAPSVVLPGEPVAVTISGGVKFGGTLTQTVSGPETSEMVLIKGGSGYVPRSGGLNEYNFNTQGDYVVTVEDSERKYGLKASCSFKVFKPCPTGTEAVGANVAFIIDNSGSHGGSDCPGVKSTKDENGRTLFECTGKTNREKAVEGALSILENVGKSGGRSTSYVASAVFPKDFTSGSVTGRAGWVDPSANMSSVLEDMKIVRKPLGLTPYGEGLKAADRLFGNLADTSKDGYVIFVTDGFPTDRDPAASLELAQSLRAKGVKILTVMVTNAVSEEKWLSDHRAMMNQLIEKGDGWYNKSRFTTDDAYLTSLLGKDGRSGLLDTMSDQVVRVENSDKLQSTFESLIKEEALKCE